MKTSREKEIRSLIYEDWYSKKYGTSPSDAFEHYMEIGYRLQNWPNPFFSPDFFCAALNLSKYTNPLLAYLSYQHSQRIELPFFFDITGYLSHYADVDPGGTRAFTHYVATGSKERRAPGYPIHEIGLRANPSSSYEWATTLDYLEIPTLDLQTPSLFEYRELIDEDFYLAQLDQISFDVKSMSTLEHYSIYGSLLGLYPNTWFSPNWYSSCYRNVFIEPLYHYIINSKIRTLIPSPAFPSGLYLNRHPDVAASELNPLYHFIKYGLHEARNLGFDKETIYYLHQQCPNFNWPKEFRTIDFIQGDSEKKTKTKELQTICRVSDVTKKTQWQHLSFTRQDKFLIDYFKNYTRDADVVSFDLWDTILHLKCDPKEINLISARALWLAAKRYEIPQLPLITIYILRNYAQNACSNTNSVYSYDDVLDLWISLCAPSIDVKETLSKEMREIEKTVWTEASVPNYTICNLIKKIKSPKYIISNTSLPIDFIYAALDKNNISEFFDDIYIASATVRSKFSGNLFDLAMPEHDRDMKKLVHFKPSHKGGAKIEAMRIHSSTNNSITFSDEKISLREVMNNSMEAMSNSTHDDLDARLQQIATTTKVSQKKRYKNPQILKSIELEAAIAPAFVGFVMMILEKALQLGVEVIYFFSREGYFFKRIYDAIIAHDIYNIKKYPSSEMLDVSRSSTFASSLRCFNVNELNRLWAQYPIQSPIGIANTLNLDVDLVVKIADEIGIDPEHRIPYPWTNDAFLSLLSHKNVVNHAEKRIKLQRNQLIKYLKSKNLDPSKNSSSILFVDIGWRGSIQDNLSSLFTSQVHGVYLGLHKFNYEQPFNCIKSAYLFDHNQSLDHNIADVSPVEFLCNSTGGTVVSYGREGPVKYIIAPEEKAISDICLVQDIILHSVGEIAKYIKLRGLTSDDLKHKARDIIRNYILNPPERVANGFAKLTHNEAFGANYVHDMSFDYTIIESANINCTSIIHDNVSSQLTNSRWPQAIMASSKFKKVIENLSSEKRLALPRNIFNRRIPSNYQQNGLVASIYIPAPARGSGGHRTIFNYAKGLCDLGAHVHILSEAESNDLEWIEEELKGKNYSIHRKWHNQIRDHIAIATVAKSAHYVSSAIEKQVKKIYFVQDYEAIFHPMSYDYINSQNSYALGLQPITIGKWMSHRLHKEYGAKPFTAGIGVDPNSYFYQNTIKSNCIAFLCQPDKHRRLSQLAVDALKIVKAHCPSVQIISYGTDLIQDFPFEATHLGLINNLSDLNILYNKCTAGICLSSSNPSRIPFEMMAAGCIPVDLYRYNNLFDYESNTALLAYQTDQSLARALLQLILGDAEGRRLKCINSVKKRTLQWEIDVALNSTLAILEDTDFCESNLPKRLYTTPPIISEFDMTSEAYSFCKYQEILSDEEV